MRKSLALATLGAVVALVPAVFCQTPSDQQATPDAQAEPQVRVIAPDDQPSKEQMARLFDAMHLRQQMANMTKTLPAMMQQQVSQQIKSLTASASGTQLTPEQQAAVDKLMKKYMEKALSLYPPDEMIDDLSGIYQRHLSKEDVDGIIAFYTSPAGQHMVELTPVAMKEYMPLVMGHMQERSKALTDEMKKDMQEAVPGWTPPTNGPAAK
jgi:uncharacterized protein